MFMFLQEPMKKASNLNSYPSGSDFMTIQFQDAAPTQIIASCPCSNF
jgi:hypothetical protein